MLLPSAYPQHKLNNPNFIPPMLYNALYGLMKAGVAVAADRVTVMDQTLTLTNPSEISLQPNQEVFVWLGRYFYLCTAEEKVETEKQIALQAEHEKQQDIDRLNKARQDADKFYRQYDIPFKYDVGIKDTLSGLSESSNGDGWKTNTVIHIHLTEDVNVGRLNRRKGDFLCAAARGTNQVTDERTDGDGNRYNPVATCKQCLKLMEKHKVRL